MEELVERVKLGDSESFRLVVLHFQQRMYAYCLCMLGSPEEAEDAVQDVFLLAFTRMDQYVRRDSFSAWLYKIAYHQCLNLLRRRNGWIRLLTHYKEQIASSQPCSDDSIILKDLLDKLGPHDRHLVILRVLEDKSFDEISVITTVKSATLRKQFERIKKKLKHDLNEEVANDGRTWSSAPR
jgi:RNA polymerase sigma-70 factor (ECF subfamily)